MKIYRTRRNGKLMAVRAYLKGPEAEHFPRLLIDTGSTYTIIGKEILKAIGCSLATSSRQKRIVAASGYMDIPSVQVERFNCLGQHLENMFVLAHTFPSSTYIDGLLGMDFLSKYVLEIKPQSGEIVRSQVQRKA